MSRSLELVFKPERQTCYLTIVRNGDYGISLGRNHEILFDLGFVFTHYAKEPYKPGKNNHLVISADKYTTFFYLNGEFDSMVSGSCVQDIFESGTVGSPEYKGDISRFCVYQNTLSEEDVVTMYTATLPKARTSSHLIVPEGYSYGCDRLHDIRSGPSAKKEEKDEHEERLYKLYKKGLDLL
jgi:hypothetical protein